MTLSELIAFKRRNLGMTQRQLGERLGYAKGKSAITTVQGWESGRHPVPMNMVRPLSELLGIPLNRFIP